MKIDEAIKTLTDCINSDSLAFHGDIYYSAKLAIEALNREKANRENPDFVMVGKLPGETEK